MANSSTFHFPDTTTMNKNDLLTVYLDLDLFNHLKQQQNEVSVEALQIEKNVNLFNKHKERAFSYQKHRLLRNSYFWSLKSKNDRQTLSNLNQQWNTIYTLKSPNILTQLKKTHIQTSKGLSFYLILSKNKSQYQCFNTNLSQDRYEKDNMELPLAKEETVSNINRFSSFYDKRFNK